MTQIRWGIFGTGLMARRFAADIKLSKTGVLVAVASRDPARAQAFAAPGIAALASYEALAQSDAVDAIYVATPNATHKDLCILALRGGKGVLCEKPIATHPADLEEILAEAEKAGRVCLEGLWTAFLPGFAEIRAHLARGTLGELRQAHASLGFAHLERQGDPITDPALGGGAVLDLGIYCVGLLNHLLGPGALVAGDVTRSASGSIRNATAYLRHKGASGEAIQSSVAVSHDAILPCRLELTGTRGRIEVESLFIQAEKAKLWQFEPISYGAGHPSAGALRQVKNLKILKKVKNTLKPLLRPGGIPLACDYGGTGFQFQIDEIGACLAAKRIESAVHPLRDSLKTLKLLHKISDL
ncbi:MAG: Gfo/Idh/MocA family oxidoreductase [Pseudomonadota bacterium]